MAGSGDRHDADRRPHAELLEHRPIYRGKVVHLAVESIRLPGGVEVDLEVIRHPGASAVVPIDDQGRVVLVRQYRHAAGGWLLEVPAGKLDPGEDPVDCARRETEEETGFSPGNLESLGPIYTTPGFADEKIWLFLATDLQPSHQRLEDDELLEVELLPWPEAVAAARDGDLIDGKTVTAILRVAARFGTDWDGKR
ncbi:MAG: NUDIX hydrolase [Acidobacteriota bacterium]